MIFLNNKQKKNITFLAIGFFIIWVVIIPLILQIPIIKQIISFLFSFTDNIEYKTVYIELTGAIMGSFLAIYGALWTQREIDKKEDNARQKKYACIVYNDLKFAFNDLIKIFDITKSNYNLSEFNGNESAEKFCKTALGCKLHLSQNWISDVAQLNDVLPQTDIEQLYKFYGKLIDIDRAMQSGDSNEIRKLYVNDILWLVSGNSRKPNSYCELMLEKLKNILKDNTNA